MPNQAPDTGRGDHAKSLVSDSWVTLTLYDGPKPNFWLCRC